MAQRQAHDDKRHTYEQRLHHVNGTQCCYAPQHAGVGGGARNAAYQKPGVVEASVAKRDQTYSLQAQQQVESRVQSALLYGCIFFQLQEAIWWSIQGCHIETGHP